MCGCGSVTMKVCIVECVHVHTYYYFIFSTSAPSDYNSVVQVLVFQPGETSMTFSVDTIIDSIKEPNEHFKVVLTSDDENCDIGSPDESFVTIVDPTGTYVGDAITPEVWFKFYICV